MRMRARTCGEIATATATNWTNVVCAVVTGPSSSAAVPTSLRAPAIVTATSWTPWACAAEAVSRMKMEMAYATTWTTAWACWTIAGSATGLVPSTTADVIPFQRAIAIAMATSSTKLACVGECTLDLDMDGICDDVDTCLGNLDECGICNGPGAVYQCGCDFLPLGDCDCEGNPSGRLGRVWWRLRGRCQLQRCV